MIYFIGARSQQLPVKIGTSRSAEDRLADLQTAHHEKLVLFAKVPGGIGEERELHRLFKADRVFGEWFQRSEEIELFIGLIGHRSLPLHLAVKWIKDDREVAKRQPKLVHRSE